MTNKPLNMEQNFKSYKAVEDFLFSLTYNTEENTEKTLRFETNVGITINNTQCSNLVKRKITFNINDYWGGYDVIIDGLLELTTLYERLSTNYQPMTFNKTYNTLEIENLSDGAKFIIHKP